MCVYVFVYDVSEIFTKDQWILLCKDMWNLCTLINTLFSTCVSDVRICDVDELRMYFEY